MVKQTQDSSYRNSGSRKSETKGKSVIVSKKFQNPDGKVPLDIKSQDESCVAHILGLSVLPSEASFVSCE